MHILIDFENVNNSGLEGAGYLTEDDHVTLFYSHSCENIQQGYFDLHSTMFISRGQEDIRKNGGAAPAYLQCRSAPL